MTCRRKPMNTIRLRVLQRLTAGTVLVLLAALLQERAGGAEWGSIRANNREHWEHERAGGRRLEPARVPVREIHRENERERVVRERPHWDWDAARHEGYYWSGYRPGV